MAVAQLEPQTTQLVDAGFKVLDVANNYASMREVQPTVVIAKKAWYTANPDAMIGFMRGWRDTLKWMYDPKNKDEFIKIIQNTMKVEATAAGNVYQRHVAESQLVPLDLRVDPKRVQLMAENLRKLGLENIPTDVTKYIDNTLADRVMAM
jgi:ABC-type nitrate/sulfonate/bicarbonate transport system substrate-binding protein